MKKTEYTDEKSREEAKKSRKLRWTIIYGIFVLIVIWSLIGAYITMSAWWDKISIPIFK